MEETNQPANHPTSLALLAIDAYDASARDAAKHRALDLKRRLRRIWGPDADLPEIACAEPGAQPHANIAGWTFVPAGPFDAVRILFECDKCGADAESPPLHTLEDVGRAMKRQESPDHHCNNPHAVPVHHLVRQRLLELPDKIHERALAVCGLRECIATDTIRLEAERAAVAAAVTAERDDTTGKPRWPNDTARQAEIARRMADSTAATELTRNLDGWRHDLRLREADYEHARDELAAARSLATLLATQGVDSE